MPVVMMKDCHGEPLTHSRAIRKTVFRLHCPSTGTYFRGMAGVALAVLLFASCVPALALPSPRGVVELRGAGSLGTVRIAGYSAPDLAAKGRVLVGVKPGVATASAVSQSVGAVDGKVVHAMGGGRILVVDIPDDADILATAARLATQAGVEFAEPDRVVYPQLIPNDPEYPSQWHLPKISAPAAWDIITSSPQVVIAVIDSGIDSDHPDLAGRLWVNTGEIPGNGRDDDRNGYIDDVNGWNFEAGNNNIEAIPDGIDQNGDGTPDEQVNHGTLTAGLAAAAGNNGFGCVGVTWSATIMPVKVFDDDGTTFVSTVVDAMYYAARNGAFIMNLSIGAPYEDSFTPPIQEMWNRGGLTVCAGGNEGREITNSRSSWTSPTCNNGPSPLTDNMVIGVGGLTQQDRKASWSNYDGSSAKTFVDVFAPGLNIFGPAVYYPSIPRFDSYFTTNSGTSFAAPLVSGLAALLKAQNPARTNAEIVSLIRSSCDNIDALNPGFAGKLGMGRINCARAVGADLPVAAPTNLQAYDTPADQGGSITLLWTRSIDDGGGSNAVTHYVISRARDALPVTNAGWTEIAQVPAGTGQYLDANTIDGVGYFYRVAAVGANSRSESTPVGPIYSYDDSAPPRVDSLRAYDRPVDSGGAIELDWAGYAGPDDLAGFRIYRNSTGFTTVLNMLPAFSINNPNARSFTDTTTADGIDYFYAVVGYDTLGNSRPDVVAIGPVQSFANGPVTFEAGLHFMGAPIIPEDGHPATLFGIPTAQLRYARYNNALDNYSVYSGEPLSEFLRLDLGRGFWLQLPSRTTFVPDGAIAPAGNLTIPVEPGWQQVGNPYFGTLNFSASTVTHNSNTMDLDSADSLGILASYAWKYDRVTNDYVLLHPVLGQSTAVEAWGGFWVLADKECSLTLMRPSGTAGVAEAGKQTVAAGEWPLQILARGKGNVDSANYCGVSSAPSGIVSPPSSGGGVALNFQTKGSRSAQCATAFETTARPAMEWPFTVSWQQAQGTVRLEWPDLSRVPREYSLVLEDLDTGRTLSMRHQTSYAVDAASAEGTRRFVVKASQQAPGGVQITAMSAQATAVGAQVAFTLSSAATCDVAVLNIAGRRVGTVETGKVRGAGANVAVWNGRSDGGSRVPSGQYLVRITAQSDDGTSTSALRSMRIGN